MTTPKTKHMEPGSNHIQTIHNLNLAIMDLKSQHDVAPEGFIRARDVRRAEKCRSLLPANMFPEAFRRLTKLRESFGRFHGLHRHLGLARDRKAEDRKAQCRKAQSPQAESHKV